MLILEYIIGLLLEIYKSFNQHSSNTASKVPLLWHVNYYFCLPKSHTAGIKNRIAKDTIIITL